MPPITELLGMLKVDSSKFLILRQRHLKKMHQENTSPQALPVAKAKKQTGGTQAPSSGTGSSPPKPHFSRGQKRLMGECAPPTKPGLGDLPTLGTVLYHSIIFRSQLKVGDQAGPGEKGAV